MIQKTTCSDHILLEPQIQCAIMGVLEGKDLHKGCVPCGLNLSVEPAAVSRKRPRLAGSFPI